MNRYENYVNTGFEWIGEIPSSWEILRLRFLGEIYGGLTGKNGDDFNQDNNLNNKPYIPYTNIFNNTYISKDNFHQVVLREDEKQNLVKKFDLFFLMSSETYQDLGKSCILIDDIEELYLNSFCKGFRVNKPEVDALFLNYQLLGHIHKELISVEGKGFTRINLRQDRLINTPIFLPPFSEQKLIARYLDKKTKQIDSMIEKIQKKIELLKEQRTSLINQCVTKGLDPNAPMKDSGVEWIGDIPKHWGNGKMGYILKNNDGGVWGGDIQQEDGGTLVVRSTEITINGNWDLTNPMRRLLTEKEIEKCRLFKDDIVITKSSGSPNHIGKSVIVTKEVEKLNCCYSNFVQRIKFKKEYSAKLYHHILNSNVVREQFRFLTQSTTGLGNLNRTTLNLIELPFIPFQEQKLIARYLDKKTEQIDSLLKKIQKKIERSKEYRQSLISSVVTGKVRITEDML